MVITHGQLWAQNPAYRRTRISWGPFGGPDCCLETRLQAGVAPDGC